MVIAGQPMLFAMRKHGCPPTGLRELVILRIFLALHIGHYSRAPQSNLHNPVTNCLLLKLQGCSLPLAEVYARTTVSLAQTWLALRPGRVAYAAERGLVYAYLFPIDPIHAATHGELPHAHEVEHRFAAACSWGQQIEVSALEHVFARDGASVSAQPAFHYVVEMDPEQGWADELAQWYDTEHMPGLAGVEGCVRAARHLNHGHGPRSFACYDLVSQETLGSPAWLEVRGTSWSDRVRPHFTNTRRTMLRIAA